MCCITFFIRDMVVLYCVFQERSECVLLIFHEGSEYVVLRSS